MSEETVVIKPGDIVRIGHTGRVVEGAQVEQVRECQDCEGRRLMVLKAYDFGGYSYGMVGEELRNGLLPDALEQLTSYNDLLLVICLDCGQLQGTWPVELPTKPTSDDPVVELPVEQVKSFCAAGLLKQVWGPTGEFEYHLTSEGEKVLRAEMATAEKTLDEPKPAPMPALKPREAIVLKVLRGITESIFQYVDFSRIHKKSGYSTWTAREALRELTVAKKDRGILVSTKMEGAKKLYALTPEGQDVAKALLAK